MKVPSLFLPSDSIFNMRCCQRRRCRPAALLLAFVLLTNMLLFTACSGASDASMQLKQTKGTVYVTNKNGRTRQAERDLILYSGYHVSTWANSYAWIGPDEEKQIKLAQNSEIEILQEKQSLTVNVLSGSLFFHVPEPFGDEETVEICTSSIRVDMRGSCGWVSMPDAQHMELYLLKGEAVCAAGESTASVSAGEKAVISEGGEISISSFTIWDIPLFAAEGLSDYDLRKAIQEDSCLDVTANPAVHYWGLLAYTEGEILYTGMIDFEMDSNPELAVIHSYERDKQTIVNCEIYRTSPEENWFGGVSIPFFSYDSLGDGRYQDGSISLMEADGKLYLRFHTAFVFRERDDSISMRETDHFFGFFLEENNSTGTCTFIKSLQHSQNVSLEGINNTYNKIMRSGPATDISAGEYEAFLKEYREVQILAYTPDNMHIIATAGNIPE